MLHPACLLSTLFQGKFTTSKTLYFIRYFSHKANKKKTRNKITIISLHVSDSCRFTHCWQAHAVYDSVSSTTSSTVCHKYATAKSHFNRDQNIFYKHNTRNCWIGNMYSWKIHDNKNNKFLDPVSLSHFAYNDNKNNLNMHTSYN